MPLTSSALRWSFAVNFFHTILMNRGKEERERKEEMAWLIFQW